MTLKSAARLPSHSYFILLNWFLPKSCLTFYSKEPSLHRVKQGSVSDCGTNSKWSDAKHYFSKKWNGIQSFTVGQLQVRRRRCLNPDQNKQLSLTYGYEWGLMRGSSSLLYLQPPRSHPSNDHQKSCSTTARTLPTCWYNLRNIPSLKLVFSKCCVHFKWVNVTNVRNVTRS